MNVNDLKSFVLFLAKKSQSGANPTPNEFNLAMQRAYMEWIMQKYGNDNAYQGGEIPPVAWQRTQKISDDLSFLITDVIISSDATGKIERPDDYLHLSSIRKREIKQLPDCEIEIKEIFVDVLRDNELSSVLNSSIVNPTRKYPVCAFYQNHIQMFPKEPCSVVFTYLKRPRAPRWGFITQPNGRIQYSAANSVDPDAPDEAMNDIAIRILRYLGISIRDNELQQYANAMKQEQI